MQNIIFLILCLLYVFIANSQPYFMQNYSWANVQFANRVLQKDSIYILGGTYRNSSTEFIHSYFATVSIEGNNWNRTDLIGTYLESALEDFIECSDNGYLMLNSEENINSGFVFGSFTFLNENLQVTNNISNEDWQVQENQTYCAAFTSDSLLIIGGWIQKPNIDGWNLYLTKLSPETGELLLDTIYTYFNTPFKLNWIQDIAATPDGGAYLLATINYSGDTGDIALIKIDSLGNWQWNLVYNPTTTSWLSRDLAGNIIITSDGGVLFSYVADKPNIATRISYTHKLNAQFQTEWIKDEYFSGGIGPSLIQLSDSNFFLANGFYLNNG